MIIQNTTLLLKENKQLWAINNHQKAKRARKRLFISYLTTFMAIEGVQLV